MITGPATPGDAAVALAAAGTRLGRDRMDDGADELWDAGDTGCGDLVLELRRRLARLRVGQVLRLVARDPGAPEDIPAWCRLTGHMLVAQKPPVYDIRKEG